MFPAKPTPAAFSLRLEFTHGGFQPQARSGVLCVFSQTFLENAVVLNGSQTQKNAMSERLIFFFFCHFISSNNELVEIHNCQKEKSDKGHDWVSHWLAQRCH